MALSSLAFLLQNAPFIVLSFVAYFNEIKDDMYLLVGIIVTHLSSIYNGFLYGLTNQRFQPSYRATVSCHSQQSAVDKRRQVAVVGVPNEAFSDDVL